MTGERNGNDDGSGNRRNVPRYLGPYEAWNFGDGRGYALPVLRKYSRYYTALAELGAVPGPPPEPDPGNGFFPTLWEDAPRRFIPFVAERPVDLDPAPMTPEDLTRMLQSGFVSAFTELVPTLPFSSDTSEERSSRIDILLKVKKSRFRVAFPVAKKAMHRLKKPEKPVWYPDEGLCRRIGYKKKITVIAVIDDGLPFAHSNFRDRTGKHTRVEFCWLQSVAIDPCQRSVLFGREYTRPHIECLIKKHGDDEDSLYRAAGATIDTEELGSLIDRHGTHGAHVMDLAAGYARARREKAREEIRIIAVQLPNTIAWDTSGFGKDAYMLSAFHYIFDRADIIAEGYGVENLRLVINFSYGFSGGRHDGETELEAAIDELIEARRCRQATRTHPLLGSSPTALMLPAGNTFLDRLHGLICPEDFRGNTATFYWRIQPNDRTTSYLELWFWEGFKPDGYAIELYDPSGDLRSYFEIKVPPNDQIQQGADPNTMQPVQNAGYESIGQISVDVHRADPEAQKDTGRYRVLIVVAPTDPEEPSLPRAEAGKWKVMIARGVHLIDQPIHCWIQRSADPESLRSGSRQSYLDDRAYEESRFTCQGDFAETDTKTFVRRFGSLNGLATGGKALVAGGYRLGAGLGSGPADARPSRYSSAGVLQSQPCDPSLASKEAKVSSWPEKQVSASSMSDRSRALPGTIAAGVRSGSHSLVQGTSAAAPLVARQLAEIFAEKEHVPAQTTDNYRSLLSGYEPGAREPTDEAAPGASVHRKHDPNLMRARLGTILVPPNHQPGIE
jgi:hypothetical protein